MSDRQYGTWTGEGNPTRDDCIRLAAEAATAAAEALPEAQLLKARGWAEVAKAWAMLAAQADEMSMKPQWAGTVRVEKTLQCGHGQTAWYDGVRWVHPLDLGSCDEPPTPH